SGILAVDGGLYLWARNAGNARLARSADRGATWTWADWTFAESFGCPTFAQFGRDYEGARDGFVYVLSPDADSAYVAADRMVLARVPRRSIPDRSPYTSFAGLDADGSPRWSAEIRDRRPDFEHEGGCGRSSLSYVPSLRRFLMVQIPYGRDARWKGGLAI